MAANPKILKDPAPMVGVSVLADSSINLAVKPWVAVDDVIPVSADLYQVIVELFRDRNISIPFPQREVRVLGPAPLGEAVAQ
jgi:small conductance mechanosensitive channel